MEAWISFSTTIFDEINLSIGTLLCFNRFQYKFDGILFLVTPIIRLLLQWSNSILKKNVVVYNFSLFFNRIVYFLTPKLPWRATCVATWHLPSNKKNWYTSNKLQNYFSFFWCQKWAINDVSFRAMIAVNTKAYLDVLKQKDLTYNGLMVENV